MTSARTNQTESAILAVSFFMTDPPAKAAHTLQLNVKNADGRRAMGVADMTNHEPKHPTDAVPAAWMVTFNNGRKIVLTEPDPADWLSVTPLYAHPPADMAGLDGLIERLRYTAEHGIFTAHDNGMQAMPDEAATQLQALAARVKVLEAENEQWMVDYTEAVLDVEAQEALQVSAYHAGLKAGWNFCVDDNHDGQQAALASTDHIKELRRIREARAALKETEQ